MYLLRKGEWTTGLIKIIFIAAASVIATHGAGLLFSWEAVLCFLIFLLSPHVTNILDTRPLRVWKWTSAHFLFYLALIPSLQREDAVLFLLAMMGIWWYIEKTKQAMLGDNGAALVGGVIAWLGLSAIPLVSMILLLLLYTGMTFMAEKVSLHAVIQQTPFLKRLDQWGWKET